GRDDRAELTGRSEARCVEADRDDHDRSQGDGDVDHRADGDRRDPRRQLVLGARPQLAARGARRQGPDRRDRERRSRQGGEEAASAAATAGYRLGGGLRRTPGDAAPARRGGAPGSPGNAAAATSAPTCDTGARCRVRGSPGDASPDAALTAAIDQVANRSCMVTHSRPEAWTAVTMRARASRVHCWPSWNSTTSPARIA